MSTGAARAAGMASTGASRVAGMAAALGVLWLGFDLASGGLFLTPHNLYNLAVQTSVVAIMACGMVLVIVARHIDLAVGSVLGVCGMLVAVLQAEWLAREDALAFALSLALGLALGAAIGAWQGWWVAWRGVPAFVVTLAGLLVFRGGAYLLTDGRTVAPLHPAQRFLGGGLEGSLGEAWSLALCLAACAALVAATLRARARRRAHAIALRPLAADAGMALLGCALVLGFALLMNAAETPGGGAGRGIPTPVLILALVALATGCLARRTRFGRAVFALGGNPEAARLAGIDVRRTTLGVFTWMGLLAALAGIVTTARLDAGTSSMGTLLELSVIAAAVIGGTSLAGGVGSVGGALLGALVMQSLDSGMLLLGLSSAVRQVAIGLVLIGAVWADLALRRRSGA